MSTLPSSPHSPVAPVDGQTAASARKVLVPILTLKDNGGGAVAMALARSMALAGDRVTVLSSRYHGDEAASRPENAGLSFVLAPSFGGSRLLSLVIFFLRAAVFSFRERPLLVYTHIATRLIPNFCAQRPLWLAQDLEYRFFAGWKRRLMKWLFVSVAMRARLLVTSEWLALFFRRIGADIAFAADVGIAGTMADTALAQETQARPTDFLLIAKRGTHKRGPETREVAFRLAQHGWRVVLIDQERRGSDMDTPLGLQVLDAVSAAKMRSLFEQSCVFISLSRAEGYGLTPLEALANSCGVVSTPTPSTRRLAHPLLRVLHGSDALVEHCVDAAVDTRQGRSRLADSPTPGTAYRGPFMEDWARRAAGACSARSASVGP